MCDSPTRERQMDGDPLTLEETQHIALGVLDELDAFCKQHDIPYFVIGGSLIGAVRSQDLVPWDDDIDVAMKRSDFERFCREYADNERYKLLTYQRAKNYRHAMAKLVDRSTYFVEPTVRDDPYGVFVDVFALDEVSSPKDRLVARMAIARRVYNFAHVVSPLGAKGNPFKFVARTILAPTVGRGDYKTALSKLEKRASSGRGDYLINHWGSWGVRECVNGSCFASSVPVTIRGKEYPAPVGYEEWLTRVYGDYMSPPEDPPLYHGYAYRLG